MSQLYRKAILKISPIGRSQLLNSTPSCADYSKIVAMNTIIETIVQTPSCFSSFCACLCTERKLPRSSPAFKILFLPHFQLTNKCCKDHFLSQLLEINDNLRYRCKDETDFSNCLRKVNTAMSLFVGDYYFNRVSLKCYKIEEQEYCYGTLCGSLILKISNVTVPRF